MTSVIIFGDSYVAAANRGRPGYARLLPILMLWRGARMGRGGTGFVQTSGDRLPYPDRLPELLASDADVAIIQATGNDALCDLGEVEAAARAFLATAAGAFREVYVIGPMWAGDGADNLPTLAAVMRRVCDDLAIPYVDASEWLTLRHIGPDGAHPTWIGHAHIARKAASAIRARRPSRRQRLTL